MQKNTLNKWKLPIVFDAERAIDLHPEQRNPLIFFGGGISC